MIHNETGSSAGNFFQILSLDIIDFHLLVSPSLGVIGSQRSGFLKNAVRQLLSLGLYDHMGAGDSLRVKPPVAAVGKLEVEFFILVVVFSDIDMESVAGKVVERAACDLYLFSAGIMAFDIAVLRKLFLDLYKILLQSCDIHGGTDGFQMVDLRLCLRELFRDGLVGPFLFIVLIEIPLCVLLGCHRRIQRDRNFRIVVII